MNQTTTSDSELKKDEKFCREALIEALPEKLREIVRDWDALSPEIQSALYQLAKAGKGGAR